MEPIIQPVITPTIGRKVWYWPNENDIKIEYMESLDSAQPFDATVVFVHNLREVNLFVVDHNSNSYDRCGIPLIQPGDEKPDGGYCEWMPCQIGQATAK